MIPQSSTILGVIPLLLVVLAIKALIASQGVSTHFVRPFEVWLVLDLLQNLMHRGVVGPDCLAKSLRGLLLL